MVGRRLLTISRSHRPADATLLQQIRAGSASLKSQREGARAEGLGEAALPKAPPALPMDRNAAAHWDRLVALLRRRPLEAADQKLLERGEPVIRLSALLTRRRDVSEIVRGIAARERAVFGHNWGQGARFPAPSFAVARTAARWLGAEILVRAAKGQDREALRLLDQGYRMAGHWSAEPGIRACQAVLTVREELHAA
ncbi:MAG: hypothetical protein FJX77_10210, partial [Armatimonadetes bacterium]|nr:hypothetical protein [Armatimonadota bacterium]